MFKKNQKGMIDPIFIIVLVLVLAVGGFIYWRTSQDKDEDITQTSSQQIVKDQVTEQASDPAEQNEPKTIPDGWVKHENKGLDISIYFPSTWKVDSCDTASGFFVLIKKTSVKCGTEDWSDGPSFGTTTNIVTKCEPIDPSNTLQTKSCEKLTLGGEEVIAEKYTYLKEGAFGEQIGTNYYTYNFTNTDLNGLIASYLHYPDVTDENDTILQSLATLETLN